MDTSTVGVERAPRRFRSLEDKLRVIAEARLPGASVAAVARKHGMNANLLFGWMRQQDQGVLMERTRGRPRRPSSRLRSRRILTQDSFSCSEVGKETGSRSCGGTGMDCVFSPSVWSAVSSFGLERPMGSCRYRRHNLRC